jgi:hypothetical protein
MEQKEQRVSQQSVISSACKIKPEEKKRNHVIFMLREMIPVKPGDLHDFITKCGITIETYRYSIVIKFLELSTTPNLTLKDCLNLLRNFSSVMNMRRLLILLCETKMDPLPKWEDVPKIMDFFKTCPNWAFIVFYTMQPILSDQKEIMHETVMAILRGFYSNTVKFNVLEQLIEQMPTITNLKTLRQFTDIFEDKLFTFQYEFPQKKAENLLMSRVDLTPKVKPPEKKQKIYFCVEIAGEPIEEFSLDKSYFKEGIIPYRLKSGIDVALFENGFYETKEEWEAYENKHYGPTEKEPFPTLSKNKKSSKR